MVVISFFSRSHLEPLFIIVVFKSLIIWDASKPRDRKKT